MIFYKSYYYSVRLVTNIENKEVKDMINLSIIIILVAVFSLLTITRIIGLKTALGEMFEDKEQVINILAEIAKCIFFTAIDLIVLWFFYSLTKCWIVLLSAVFYDWWIYLAFIAPCILALSPLITAKLTKRCLSPYWERSMMLAGIAIATTYLMLFGIIGLIISVIFDVIICRLLIVDYPI